MSVFVNDAAAKWLSRSKAAVPRSLKTELRGLGAETAAGIVTRSREQAVPLVRKCGIKYENDTSKFLVPVSFFFALTPSALMSVSL